jgi:hypothetical protein
MPVPVPLTLCPAPLLAVGAVVEMAAGLPLLLAPATAISLFNSAPPPLPRRTRHRLAGAALVALGLACCFASLAPAAPAAIAIAWLYGAYNLLASALMLRAAALPSVRRRAVLAGSLLHGGLAAALVAALLVPCRPGPP